MVQVPAEASKAFEELKALVGGAGNRLSDTAVTYQPAIAQKLSVVASKFSPDFLGDFKAATRNSSPAATAPESASELALPPLPSWTVIALVLVAAYWFFSRGSK